MLIYVKSIKDLENLVLFLRSKQLVLYVEQANSSYTRIGVLNIYFGELIDITGSY